MDAKLHRLFLETVIRGALASKVVLLVTHQLHYLQGATNIILIENGEIIRQGSYGDLLAAGIEFYHDVEDDEDFGYEGSNLPEDVATLIKRSIADIHTKEIRRRRSVSFEFNERSEVRKVSIGSAPVAIGRPNFETSSFSGSGEDLQTASSEFAAMAIVANDTEAYNANDKVTSPAKISFRLYFEFLRSGSSRPAIFVMILFCVISQGLYTTTDLWIEHWAHAEERRQDRVAHKLNTESDRLLQTTRTMHIIIYSALVLGIVILSFGRSIIIFRICIKASKVIFEKLLDATIRARMYFFEQTCAGHAINRLSKDMDMIDDLIPPTLLEVLGVIFEIFGAFFILAFANPWFIIPSTIFFVAIIFVYRIYHLTAASLKRIEGNARSPVYAHLSRTLQGVTTIRAFSQEQAFVMIFDRLQDNHTASWYLFLSAQAWLAIIIDLISIVLIASISLSFFFMEETEPAIVGLVIAKMIEMSVLTQFAAGEISNTETQMISVER